MDQSVSSTAIWRPKLEGICGSSRNIFHSIGYFTTFMMFRRFCTILLCSSALLVHSLDWEYHNNTQLAQFLKNFTETTHPQIRTRLYSIGKSEKQNDLWVVEMSAVTDKTLGIPNIKLIGTVHGNEPVGRELLLHFMEHLRDGYNSDWRISWLLNNTRIHFLPNLNPDGFAVANENMCEGEHGRNTGLRGKDLNRNFPDFFHQNKIPQGPESRAVQKWMGDVPFVLSASFHGGALVANYPFDTVREVDSNAEIQPSLTPDDDVFVHLASVYARNHLTMHKTNSCGPNFDGGITNGAVWYTVIGGMQDYNYAFHGCMEITLEISCCKYPNARELPRLWDENRMALLNYCLEALRGVTGRIIDRSTMRPVANASLRVSGRDISFKSTETGEFWRLLLPGKYRLEVSAHGFYNKTVPFAVEENAEAPELTFLNVFLVNLTTSTTTVKQTTAISTSTTTRYFADTTVGGPVTDLITDFSVKSAREIAHFQISSSRKLYINVFVLWFVFVYFFWLQ